MKNLVFTYDTIRDGERGEACAVILLDDDRAEVIKAAFDPKNKGDHNSYFLRERAIGFCWSCEHIRGRAYVENSIKSVEIREG